MPGPSEVPSSGFGYPLDDACSLGPRGSLSTLNALGVPPSELSSSPAVESRFPKTLPRLHFRKKPLQLLSCASVASSHRKSRVPSALSEGLIRSGTPGSPGVSRLPGPPPILSRKRASPSFPSPRALRVQEPYDPQTPEPQGFPSRTGRPFPPKGAPSCLAFPTDDPVPPL